MIHDRMPVVLSADEAKLWLSGGPWSDLHRGLLRPCPDDWLTTAKVSKSVNAVKNNTPDILVPLGDPIF